MAKPSTQLQIMTLGTYTKKAPSPLLSPNLQYDDDNVRYISLRVSPSYLLVVRRAEKRGAHANQTAVLSDH